MEGMVSQTMKDFQQEFIVMHGFSFKLGRWAGLVVWLLEITHRQLLYRNIMVNEVVTDRNALTQKEDIEAQIEEQSAQGGEDLLEGDSYLME